MPLPPLSLFQQMKNNFDASYSQMQDLLKEMGEWAHGGDVDHFAMVWSVNFSPEVAREWLEARCFCPTAAVQLREIGVTPQQASVRTCEGMGGYVDTVGYKVSNSDLPYTYVIN